MPEKLFTRDEVSEIIQKRVERSHQSFFKRYGVKDLSELDELFNKANTVDQVKADYDALKAEHDKLTTDHTELTGQHKDLIKKYAFKSKNINPDKVTDIETYFKGKGLEVDETSLDSELQTHPDWILKMPGISEIGSETGDEPDSDAEERAYASRIFGVEL